MTEPVARGLVQVRWLLILLESAVALGFLASGDPEHRPIGLLVVCATLAAIDRLRTRGIAAQPLQHVAIDLGALAVLSILWGPHHPLQALALVEMTIVATVLPARQAWSVTSLAVGLQVLDAALQARGGEDALHLVSHVAIGAVAAVALTWFSQAVGSALVAREEARRLAETNRDRAARLALVGTLAAGVAHELATPLGSIALLAEEAEGDAGPDADRTPYEELQRQVRRCREILDRLLQRGDGRLVHCPELGVHLESWIQEWTDANPGTSPTLDCDDQVRGTTVPGDGDTWRGALWTLLDNARRAGGEIQVQARVEGPSVIVEVLDRGVGLSDEAARRAGEPFFSGWPQAGRGLGLYALRTAVDTVDGRFALSPRVEGGARARLELPSGGGG